MKVFKPQVGGKVWATSEHPNRKEGEFIGHIIEVSENEVYFKLNGDTDKLIWNFRNGGLNRFHSFSI